METSRPQPAQGISSPELFPLKEITELLIKKQGYHEGFYDLTVEFQMAVGPAGPNPSNVVPSMIVGVHRIGIARTEVKTGLGVVDASVVNPAPQE